VDFLDLTGLPGGINEFAQIVEGHVCDFSSELNDEPAAEKNH
jgi:hypothetical protein